MNTFTRRVAAVTAIGVAALGAPAAALAAPATGGDVTLPVVRLAVGIDPVAELAPNRVVARVPVDVQCFVPGAKTAYASVSVTQAVGHRVANGYGFVPGGVPCDGLSHRVTVSVVASGGGAPFRIGDAAVTASVSACPEGEEGVCESVETEPQDLLLLTRLRD
jgi:hypothetical protein